MNMNLDMMPAMPEMPQAAAMPKGDGSSLFQVIQGGGSQEMKALEGVFQQVLGYTAEQMDELQAALESQEGESSPMEVLEEWMQGLQDLLSEIGVQLEEQGFKMNAKAFAENLLQIDGQEVQTFEELQAALSQSADDAEIPVFIQSKLKLDISIQSLNPEQSVDAQENLQQQIQFAQIQMTSHKGESPAEFQAIKMNLRQLAFQTQDASASQPVDLATNVQNALQTLQGLMKQFLAKFDQIEKAIQSSIEPGQEGRWAIEAAQEGFTEDEIQLLANFKNLLTQDQEAQTETLDSEVANSIQTQFFAFQTKQSEGDENPQLQALASIQVQQGVQTPVSSEGQVLTLKDKLEQLNLKNQETSLKGDLKSSQEGEFEEVSEDSDSEMTEEGQEGDASEAKQNAQIAKAPIGALTSDLNLPEEQTFSQIRTTPKGDLIIEKVTQTTGSQAPKHPVVRQIETQISVMFDKGESRTTMTLYPENLGKVDLEISIQNDKMQLMVSVDNDKVKSILEQNINQLRDSLSQHNLHLDKSEVNIDYKQAGQQQNQSGKRKGFQHKDAKEGILQVEMEAHEGDETGRRLGYNTMEYLA